MYHCHIFWTQSGNGRIQPFNHEKSPNRFQLMNESNPGAAPVESTPSPSYKDRSTGLTVFGIFTLLLGGLCGLLFR